MFMANHLTGFGAGGFIDGTAFTATLDTDADGWDGYTLVTPIPFASLTVPNGLVTRLRVSIRAANAQAFGFDNCYIGHRAGAGDVYDFAATPTQVLFSGAGGATVTAGSTLVSDWVNFTWDRASGLTTAIHCNGGAGADNIRILSSGSISSYWKAAVSESATVDKTGYTASAQIFLISKIECDGF